jgi:hypothetical protein
VVPWRPPQNARDWFVLLTSTTTPAWGPAGRREIPELLFPEAAWKSLVAAKVEQPRVLVPACANVPKSRDGSSTLNKASTQISKHHSTHDIWRRSRFGIAVSITAFGRPVCTRGQWSGAEQMSAPA